MNDEQYKRFRKMNADNIECLYYTHNSNKNLFFLISGSSGAKYKVSISPKGKIECSCPDFKNGAKVQECVCKHCLYVIYNTLKLFDDVEHEFFDRLYFTTDEVHKIHDCYRQLLRAKKAKRV